MEQVVGAGVHQWLALPGATTAAVHRITLDGGPDVVLKHFIWPSSSTGTLTQPSERHGRSTVSPAWCLSLRCSASPAWRYQLSFAGNELFVPAWADRSGDWESLIEAASSLDVGGNWFIHRDYRPWNVLSHTGHIPGIVDWMSAGPGPWQIDVSHCRLNLVLLGRPEAADAYVAAYERLSGRRYDPRWDALNIVDALPLYGPRNHVDQWGGCSVLAATERDADEQRVRIDAFARQTAARLDEGRV